MIDWSWQVTLGDVAALLASAATGGAGWAYARHQATSARREALRTAFLAALQRCRHQVGPGREIATEADWETLATMLPAAKGARLRALMAGYRQACSSLHSDPLGQRLYTDPQRVRVHVLLMLRLLRRKAL